MAHPQHYPACLDMNWVQFQRNVGTRVQLEPNACRLTSTDEALAERNDDWIIQSVSADEIELRNIETGHMAKLGKDHVYDFRSNPGRSAGGLTYGFLVLKVQIFIKGVDLWVRPNSRPGERVGRHQPLHASSSHTLTYLAQQIRHSGGWSGRPHEFNRYAFTLLYGEHISGCVVDPPDYFSALVASDLVFISSIVDMGNRADGKPDTVFLIEAPPPAGSNARPAG